MILAPWSSDYSESSVQVIHWQVSHKLGERRGGEGRGEDEWNRGFEGGEGKGRGEDD